VDDKRIYVCGFSNGAFMTYRLGAELSERIAAIAVVEGTIGAKEPTGSILKIPNPSRPIPIIAFHGKEDRAVPYNGGVGVDGIDFLSVADSISFWVKLDGCNITPKTTTSHNGNIVETDYTGGIGCSEVVLITIGNGKHDWPNAALPNQISATDLIWEFFMKH
jgi:polyhydroxybutyrate depolymerase